ncbi:hypothetical protein QF000_005749 [Paraburkholderia atlantica]|uniref:hypothetical protein n=1 Tax=Paraburkholderia atlantica TaxID=2654982 RepID=UPI003D1E31DA
MISMAQSDNGRIWLNTASVVNRIIRDFTSEVLGIVEREDFMALLDFCCRAMNSLFLGGAGADRQVPARPVEHARAAGRVRAQGAALQWRDAAGGARRVHGVPLRGKLPDAINDPSIDQLADHSRPNAQQRKALIFYDGARSKCESELSEGYGGVARTSFIAHASKSKKLRARLYSGQIDFGTFVSQDQDNLEAFNGSLDTINTEDAHEKAKKQRVENEAAAQQQMQRQIIANQQQALLQQRAQYEAAQQRQQMQDLSNSLRELGNSFQRNAPVVTSCYSSYGTTSCTTR